MKEQYIYLKDEVHKDQLRALMKECGWNITPDTFRSLKKNGNGWYDQTVIKVTDNVAVCLPPEAATIHRMEKNVIPMHEVLAPKMLSDIKITLYHPSGLVEPLDGSGYVTACVKDSPEITRPANQSLITNFAKGHLTDMEIAAQALKDDMIGYYRIVTTKVDVGSRWTNGELTIYQGEHDGEACYYKDLTAFDEKDGICFISESNLNDYKADMKDGKEIDMSRYGDDWHELVYYARDLALRNPEKVARHAVERATWQSAFTEIEVFHNNCEPDDILTLEEEVQDKFDMFVEENGRQPNYAEVFIEYKDDQASQRDMIALNDQAGEYADEEVVFTCSSFDEFKQLTRENNGEDFIVREIYGYHTGSMDGQKRSFDDAHIHDELDEIIRQAEQADERIIMIDMDMTPQQLKDVLAKEGIKLLDVLPGIDEPLPLNKVGGNVAQVYLRVACDSVIDWADDYMYRDAKNTDTDYHIDKLSHIVASQEQMANVQPAIKADDDRTDTLDQGATLIESEKAVEDIPWYEDLSRITDVNIYRNPQNKSQTEFRMRCKIDGEQLLGRILYPQQVEDLANGADKVAMAAKVFAREMTLNNPNEREQQRGMKL